MTGLNSKTNAFTDFPCIEELESEDEKTGIFRSLVATVKLQPSFDVSLEAKAVKFLESVDLDDEESADAFLGTSQVITTATMKILARLILRCSLQTQLSLLKADLIPQLIETLNPHSLSPVKAVDIHSCLLSSISNSLWLATPYSLRLLRIEDHDEQQDVYETIFKQVLAPLDKYIWHLCVNRFSIVDGTQSESFMELLAQLLRICPYNQQTVDFVLHMPVFLTIPSCLTSIEHSYSISTFLSLLVDSQREWNKKGGEVRQMGKTVHRMLRMEGIEDVIEEKLHNDKDENFGVRGAANSIRWNNLLGMNILEQQ
ncbi:hypothetical protein BLNAU_9820 [Blattamonas nauphoetae]|uniref:Uncharacterized protein n=1 Tax=Blattamonas nauphoetae TaxID=2049346 RepID=A0ABQ9XUV9_9EUKA|nr:hypothetical protein BLNAU_9820 [Blattamonas nauphoetae]